MSAPGPWRLEVQFHPGDIRRRVRCYFLSRAHLTAWSLGALALAAALALGLAVAPRVLGELFGAQAVQGLLAERTRHGERLQQLVAHLEATRSRAEGLRLQVQKVALAYGGSAAAEAPPATTSRPAAPRSIYGGTIEQGRRLAGRVRGELAATGALLARVAAHERADAAAASATPALCPLRGVDFVLLSPFGRRRNPFTGELQFHAGVDLAAPAGSPISAPADGVVVFAGRYPMSGLHWWRLGELLVLRHGERFVTLYGHCQEILVRPGRRVRRGDPVATVGASGWSTGPHLHYEVLRRDGSGELVPVDPRLFMLDHRWRDDERLVLRAATAPSAAELPPLPAAFRR